jgi:ribosomal protein L37E
MNLFSSLWYLATFRWGKAFKSEKALALIDLEQLEVKAYSVNLIHGYSEKQHRKNMAKLFGKTLNKLVSTEFGIEMFNSGYDDIDSMYSALQNMSSFDRVMVVLRPKQWELLEQDPDRGRDRDQIYNSLRLTELSVIQPFDIFSNKVRETYLSMMKRQGKVPSECENCGDEDLYINRDFTCANCGYIHESLLPLPSMDVKVMYKEIVKYQIEFGVQLMEQDEEFLEAA